jgi:general secretion pathway protein G
MRTRASKTPPKAPFGLSLSKPSSRLPLRDEPFDRLRASGSRQRAFTLIELLVVMAALALLLSIAAPRYVEHVDRARDAVLKQNLAGMREAIDKFYADRSRYPTDLQELVKQRYLREIPLDPVTDRTDTWVPVPPQGQDSGLADVRSGANGSAGKGGSYASW